ncbi:MAG TPA: hypothetical protein VFY27_07050 [Woeseiaceae bacterium]|nr:hypothetical protein [Woeseiaceae bacterium]
MCRREAARLAAPSSGYFLDQFTNASRAVDWQAHNVIVELFDQLHRGAIQDPDWFVMGAGTGGTAALVDRMSVIPDAASYGAARWLSAKLDRPVGARERDLAATRHEPRPERNGVT